ncbi:ISL1 (predicted) [Pycnogonum litorale]
MGTCSARDSNFRLRNLLRNRNKPSNKRFRSKPKSDIIIAPFAACSALTAKISPSKSEEMSETPPQKKRRMSLCVGCGSRIQDQYILRVAPDLEWHAACLKCADCHQFLDETCTCFVREGKTYCKRDYVRLFGAKCAKCDTGFSKNDFVMRARTKIYHIDCFRCVACSRQLIPGDEFALRDHDGGLFCKADHEVMETSNATENMSPHHHNHHPSPHHHHHHLQPSNNNNNNIKNNNCANVTVKSEERSLQMAANAEPVSGTNSNGSSKQVRQCGGSRSHGAHKQNSDQKTTRVRTVLNEKQLHTLRTCYNANARPDALMKEQLVEMTSLSPRVIRVWFQNKRCKDKKRQIFMKQMQQQEKDGRRLPPLAGMQGVPMIASSPVRHESPMPNMTPIDVQTYQPPWKALSEFAMQPDIDTNSAPFQHLVNQMHGYDSGDPTGRPPSLSYLGPSDDSLTQPHSNMSSQIPGTPSEMSTSPSSE